MTITGSITALPGVIDGFVIAPQSDFTPAEISKSSSAAQMQRLALFG